MKPAIKTYIQQMLPQGITLFRDKDLYVKRAKKVDGRDLPVTLTKVVKLNLSDNQSDAEQKKEFEKALQIALACKREMELKLTSKTFTSLDYKAQPLGTGLLQDTFDKMFQSTWGASDDKQQTNVKNYFKDIVEFFGKDKKLSDFFEEEISEFKTWVARKIAEREKNMTGTVSNNSINKRLGVIRTILKYALRRRLLSNDHLINPDPRVKHMGIVDLPRGESKRKPAFTLEEQEMFLSTILKCGDQEWHDIFAWGFDVGQRHSGELIDFKIDNIDFGRKTIIFWRPKTKRYSVEIPLTPRCMEIAKRRRKLAMDREDRKVFPVSKSAIRSAWEKYIKLCDFNQNFTPYTTRHTFITQLVEADVNPKTVMELAGHTCIETTLTYYTKTSSNILEKAIEKLHNRRVSLNQPKEETNVLSSMIGHNSRLKVEEK